MVSRKQSLGRIPAMEKKLSSKKAFNYNFSINEFTQFELEEVPEILLGLQHVSVSKKPPVGWGRKRRRSAINVSPKVNKVSSLSPKTPLLFCNSDDDGGGGDIKNIAGIKAEFGSVPSVLPQLGFLVPSKCLRETEETNLIVSTELTLGPTTTVAACQEPIKTVDRPISNPTAMIYGCTLQHPEFMEAGRNFEVSHGANSALARRRRYELNKEKKSSLCVRLRVTNNIIC